VSAFASLAPLLAPRSVAVVGASADPTRIGGRPIAYMKARGFAGPILPVNPNRTEIQGLPAYPDIASLPEVPDAAIVAVPAAQVVETVAALGDRGVKAAPPGLRRRGRPGRRCRPAWSRPPGPGACG
jgi:acyl-CoA synthetase (NDP forming)